SAAPSAAKSPPAAAANRAPTPGKITCAAAPTPSTIPANCRWHRESPSTVKHQDPSIKAQTNSKSQKAKSQTAERLSLPPVWDFDRFRSFGFVCALELGFLVILHPAEPYIKVVESAS